jgi:mRNA interferase MazF
MKKPMAASDIARFSIVTVPFPYVVQFAEKRRPALIISTAGLLKTHGLIWVAMITSAENRLWPEDISVAGNQACGLPAASVIRPAKIAAIEVSRVISVLGSLGKDDIVRVMSYFRASVHIICYFRS